MGLWGPPNDGQGSASGGSNFSEPRGGAAGLDFVCVLMCLRAVRVCGL